MPHTLAVAALVQSRPRAARQSWPLSSVWSTNFSYARMSNDPVRPGVGDLAFGFVTEALR